MFTCTQFKFTALFCFRPQCSTEMNQVLRLARRDGDEWVRLFASVLGSFPDSHRINSDHVTEDNLDGLAEELEEASECLSV